MQQEVQIEEVGLREGLQSNPEILSLKEKVRIVDRCLQAGIRNIQLGSFVNPKVVPQMDGVDELFTHFKDLPGIRFSALILNRRGLERAFANNVRYVNISISASDAHQRQNTGRSISESLPALKRMIVDAKLSGIHVKAGIQAVFGCHLQGPVAFRQVAYLASELIASGANGLNLADTAGFATPGTIRKRLGALRHEFDGVPLGLHLHNTLGMGFANVVAALDQGISCFDSAIAGLGGCPFMKGAEGNIATEDLVFLLQSLGKVPHIRLSQICEAAEEVRALYRRPFSGKLCRHRELLSALGMLVEATDA